MSGALRVFVGLVVVGCGAAASPSPVPTPTAAPTPTSTAAPFPIEAFTGISEDPVSGDLAAKLQSALNEFAGSDHFVKGGGMVATVMSADGTWSGTVGKADDVRDLQIDDQFGIASITKSVIAAQVMLMVEAGELGLDDLAADHLPQDLKFDITGVTIRDLLSHRSGIPDDYDALVGLLESNPVHVWTPAEVLEQVPTRQGVPGEQFEYSGTNYLLLGLVIEQLRGRPVAEVMRTGALAIDGIDRLVVQPNEKPTEPMAMPGGASRDILEARGGYIPSLASVSAFPFAGGIASDSISLARWWRAFCAGEIVSQATLTEMSAFDPDAPSFDGAYGLGLFNPAYGHAAAIGHQGEMLGYMAWAACVPEEGAVIVVLTNRPASALTIELFYGALGPFIDALR